MKHTLNTLYVEHNHIKKMRNVYTLFILDWSRSNGHMTCFLTHDTYALPYDTLLLTHDTHKLTHDTHKLTHDTHTLPHQT